MTSPTQPTQPDPSFAEFIKTISLTQETEYQRLRTQHTLHKSAMSNNLILAPLSTTLPLQILDSACGDGTWLLDICSQYPFATLTGTDIFPKHFTQHPSIPSNISFKVQNVLEEWPIEEEGKYDLVHQRYCLSQFSVEKNLSVVKRLLGLVKPGGYLQIVESDLGAFDRGEGHEGMERACEFFLRAFEEAGLTTNPGPMAEKWVKDAGASDVKVENFEFPVGVKAVAKEDQLNSTKLLVNIVDNFTMIGKSRADYWYTPEDFERLREGLLEELATVGNTWRFWVVVGKKPE